MFMTNVSLRLEILDDRSPVKPLMRFIKHLCFMFGCNILLHITSEHPVIKYVIVRLTRSSSLCSQPTNIVHRFGIAQYLINNQNPLNKLFLLLVELLLPKKYKLIIIATKLTRLYYSQNICHNSLH